MGQVTGRTPIFTIGHSDHPYEKFVRLLHEHGISAIADVRSSPYSRRSPQFNRETLKGELMMDGLAYVYLGDLLGGRPKERSLFKRGAADYEAMAKQPSYEIGIKRLKEGAQKYKIALMCSERDPLECHRCLLVGRTLKDEGFDVVHILANGSSTTHDHIEDDLIDRAGNPKAKGVVPRDIQLIEAYKEQASRVAFSEPPGPSDDQMDLI